jgi:hypothetical protein
MISTREIEMGIEQRIGELSNLQDGRTFMPQLDILSIPSFSINQTIIVNNRAAGDALN